LTNPTLKSGIVKSPSVNAYYSPDSTQVMRHLIRISIICFFICIATQIVLAVPIRVEPLGWSVFKIDQIKRLNDLLSSYLHIQPKSINSKASLESINPSSKICSCVILDLESTNYNHQHVLLLAEKTNYESRSDYIIAKNHIEKEMKHLKRMFYDRIKTISEIHQPVSCKSLYFKLKTADTQLQLYEILNADAN